MKKAPPNLLAAALAAGLLAGCNADGHQEIVFDGTAAGLHTAVAQLESKLQPERKAELDHAVEVYLANIAAPKSGQDLSATTPIGSLSGIVLSDFLAQAKRIEQVEVPAAVTRHPAWVNPRLVDSMKLELAALASNREKLNDESFLTLDQVPFTEVSFIAPPNTDAHTENNKAIFAFRMSNTSGLTVYRPTFSVRIDVPDEQLPVYRGDLTWTDPVGVPDGTSRLIDLSCCSILREPFLNKRLRQLEERAKITVELLSVEDYRKRNPLRTRGYDARDLGREHDLQTCVREVEARLDRWTPQTSGAACRRLATTGRSGSEQLAAASLAVGQRTR
ncbi:hypothetical protein H8Z72_22730 (plasmid) [Xanthomonas citri pv. citri]|uniref:hypothetical protein n=1 Tax=Xanthomonas citri TaxID=346 RepID=UPI001931324E|nr:hypothetical protein [Xanthomonas citri]QRD62654.1 hypothetical protein H8Z74_23455 [Xanthomonas citri pv. citri]QRD67189.1 hypothetical protein H8Z73_22435 [Xanthomonas citri pv. citri]QRD71766.1 hypothetical protein H8Z72_22730 [Xanthomonas citri pv. citri]